METRNLTFKHIRQISRSLEYREGFFEKAQDEKKIIWQFERDPCNLPLHPRRTLDQYGYPNLESTEPRDNDQVIFRWAEHERRTKDSVKEQEVKATEDHVDIDAAVLDEDSTKLKAQHDRGQPWATKNLEQAPLPAEITNNFKILMVDQLWSWIINDRNIVTCFPRRDTDVHSKNDKDYKCDGSACGQKRCNSPADLRDAIYFDVNGDKIFQIWDQTQCTDCLDFMASAVWHATTLFLDSERPEKPVPEELRVLHIFRESLSDIIEEYSKSFQGFKETQCQISKARKDKEKGQSVKGFEEMIPKLDNSDELACLINAEDILDELGILTKLFSEQTGVLNDMIESYTDIDKSTWKKVPHDRAIQWLEDARGN